MLYVGTSGWQYRDWKRNFYPEKLAQAERAGVDVTRTPEPREVALVGAGPDRTAFLRS